MPSLQSAAPGAKSSKITGLNPFTPFLAQPGDLDGDDEVETTLTENLDGRLRLMNPGNDGFQQQLVATAPPQLAPSTSHALPGHVPTAYRPNTVPQAAPSGLKQEKQDDSDFDSDFDDDGDPALEEFRKRRLAELQQQQIKLAENKAKGYGDYRTISQDEFLPECTNSEYVAIHFFHKDFERCKLMDHHLKKIAPQHLTCKFLRIDAEKAPFFASKLAIKTLPTLVVFKDGKTIDRLTGFDGFSDRKNPDEFPTSRLGVWLEKTGAIEYEGPESDEEDEMVMGRPSKNGMLRSRVQNFDDEV